jgi:hypothetical protein
VNPLFRVPVALVAATMLLTATACGGGDDASAVDKEDLTAQIMAVVSGEGTPDQACIRTSLDALSDDELTTISAAISAPDFIDGTESLVAALPTDLGIKVTAISNTCIGTEAPEDMVPAP